MTMYFFDFIKDHVRAADEEGLELSHSEIAHRQAANALADMICDATVEGSRMQMTVSVRDDTGPVLEITAAVESKILRKQ
jgi:hypothetical protein